MERAEKVTHYFIVSNDPVLHVQTHYLHNCRGTMKLKTVRASCGLVAVGSYVTDSSFKILDRIASWP